MERLVTRECLLPGARFGQDLVDPLEDVAQSLNPLSQRDRIAQGLLAHVGSEHRLGRDIDGPAEQRPKLHQQAAEIHQGPIWIEVDQEIQIARA